MKAPIREIFCSIQGEGPYTGVRQAFIRFAKCNLNCVYCDTPTGDVQECQVEKSAGTRKFSRMENPITPAEVYDAIAGYKGLHSVSLTGGEPLLYTSFIKYFEPGAPLYLESNMSLPERAKEVEDLFGYVAGDFKLEKGYNLNNYDEYFNDMVKCFRTLRNTKERDCFCKVVLMDGFDMEKLVEGISKIKEYISMVVLQPVTPPEGNDIRPAPIEKVMEAQEMLLDMKNTRIMPQSHMVWGAL